MTLIFIAIAIGIAGWVAMIIACAQDRILLTVLGCAMACVVALAAAGAWVTQDARDYCARQEFRTQWCG